jgi:hypothetical protein
MLARRPGGRLIVGADKGYDTRDFISSVRALGVTPHIAQNTSRRGGSGIDCRTTQHPDYALSQVIRKRIEEIFGWGKTIGSMRKTKFRSVARVGFDALLTVAGYNLVQMRRLIYAC